MPDPANDDDLGWEILVKEDGVWIALEGRHEAINLGPKDAVFTKWADKMGEEDFGE